MSLGLKIDTPHQLNLRTIGKLRPLIKSLLMG